MQIHCLLTLEMQFVTFLHDLHQRLQCSFFLSFHSEILHLTVVVWSGIQNINSTNEMPPTANPPRTQKGPLHNSYCTVSINSHENNLMEKVSGTPNYTIIATSVVSGFLRLGSTGCSLNHYQTIISLYQCIKWLRVTFSSLTKMSFSWQSLLRIRFPAVITKPEDIIILLRQFPLQGEKGQQKRKRKKPHTFAK